MRSKKFFWGFMVVILLLIFSYPIAYYSSFEKVNLRVKDKERITVGSGQNIHSKFLIYSDQEVFENSDSWLFLKFNSADYQNELEKDSTYSVGVTGWRVPFLSWYRNVIKIEK